MPPVCSICRSPARDEIDTALVSGSLTLREIAAQHPQHGRSSIDRHARTCLRLADPASRLHDMAARADLAAIAMSTVERAQEAVDVAEARGDRRGTLAALATLTRTLGAAERLFPADAGFADDDVRALLLVLVERIDDPGVRAAILDGMDERDADELAGALDVSWRRRDAAELARAEVRAVTA